MGQDVSLLDRLTRSVVEPMGYELVGVQFLQQGKGTAIVRVYIDHPDGITIDDCSAVSRQLSGVLDVEDPIPVHYQLEVSSPGLDRPLFESAHYERFTGHRARIRLNDKLDDRRNFDGILRGVADGQVLLDVDGDIKRFALSMIESAKLVPEF